MIDKRNRCPLSCNRVLLRPLRVGVENVLARTEEAILRRALAPRWAPIFIIGPPRSGTTLVYQVLLRRFLLSYFCNLVANFPLSPGIVTKILARITGIDPPPLFVSQYGDTSGWNAPSQGHAIWARWFGKVQGYYGGGVLSASALKQLRGTVAMVEAAFRAPFINKSIGHSVRLQPLAEAFPNSLFVRVHRNPLQIAQSILRGRRDYFGDQDHWFSVRPKQYDDIKEHEAINQVCEQIYYTNENIESDVQVLPTRRLQPYTAVTRLTGGTYLARRQAIDTRRD